MNVAFGHPTVAVDTHLFRLGNRIGIARGKTPLTVEKKYEKMTSARHAREAHLTLILHGWYTCKAQNPICAKCLVVKFCCSFKDFSGL